MTDATTPQPYRRGNLRTALLEAAQVALQERGVDELSLRELAREVGVSHGAPRRHFPDRQQLLDALAVAGFHRLGAVLRQATGDGGVDFAGRVHAAVAAFAHFATDNAALLDLMHTGKHRPGAATVVTAADAAFAPMIDLIRDGQERGELQQGSPEQVALVLYATVQGIATLVNTGILEPGALDALTEAAVTQFLRGTRPCAGTAD